MVKKGILYLLLLILFASFIAFGDSKDLDAICEELLIKELRFGIIF